MTDLEAPAQTFPWECSRCGKSGEFSLSQEIPDVPEVDLTFRFTTGLYIAHQEASPDCPSDSLRATVPVRRMAWQGRVFGWNP